MRWLVALLGTDVVPVAASSLAAGRTTRVHRTARRAGGRGGVGGRLPGVPRRARDHRVDRRTAATAIVAAAQELAASVGGVIDVEGEARAGRRDHQPGRGAERDPRRVRGDLPRAAAGDPDHGDAQAPAVPAGAHRRRRAAAALRGGGQRACDPDAVRAGNEAVLRARYEDASFFWRADLKVAPETMKAGLARLAFEEKLGSMADRAGRIAAVAAELGAELSTADRATLERAAALAKFDLASQMVIELTSLAGVMAREYAARAGEPQAVAQALFDMERPRSSGDTPPVTVPGAVLALADRFDMLVGLFAVGAAPTGSSDPFGLRRAAAGRDQHPACPPGAVGRSRCPAALRRRQSRCGHRASRSRRHAGRGGGVRGRAATSSSCWTRATTTATWRRWSRWPRRPRRATLRRSSSGWATRTSPTLVAALQRVRRIVPADTATTYDEAQLTEPAESGAARGAGEGDVAGRDPTRWRTSCWRRPTCAPGQHVLRRHPGDGGGSGVRAARLGLLATIRDLAAPVLDWQALGTSFTTE